MSRAMEAVGRIPLLVGLLCLGLLAWVFRGLLFCDELPAFRDAADFYYPLFQLVQAEWSAGRIPLWNPYDNLGLPLAASPTASVWYPGKLVFFLPSGFDWAYRLYLVGHVLLAAWSAYRLARHWQSSVEAAGICALAYAFGGSLLYQYANVVYLVGGAWMPLVLLAAERWFAGRRAACLGLALALAMMILGGDPQAAYHALLLIAARWAFGEQGVGQRGALTVLVSGLKIVLTPFCLAVALAAVQVLPAWEFAWRSERAVSGGARSLWDVPQALASSGPRPMAERPIGDGLLCRGTDPHLDQVYQFSLAPWRLTELVWPNCGGRQFPIHHRWFDAFAPVERVWVPSLYLGLLPLLLATCGLRLWRGPGLDRWLSWMALLAIAASFGVYGLGWLVNRLLATAGPQGASGDPVGGVYWWLTVLLPGYVQFRYPAKWMTVASLMLCLLAARGWDGLVGVDKRRGAGGEGRGARGWFGWGLLSLASLSLIGAGAVWIVRPWWSGWLAGLGPDPLFGPLDTAGAARDLTGALLHTAVLALLLTVVLGRPMLPARWSASVCLVLLVLDLALANGWMVVTAPARLWHAASPVADWIRLQQPSSVVPPRAYRHWLWLPDGWSRSGSETRLAESTAWNRATLAPQHHQSYGIDQAETYGTLMPGDLRWLIRAAEADLAKSSSGVSPGWGQTSLAALLGVEFSILPRALDSEESPADQALKAAGLDPVAADVAVRALPATMPRAWIVHQVQTVPPLGRPDAESLNARSREVLGQIGSVQAARRLAIVEGDVPLDGGRTPGESGPDESCRIVQYDPQRVVIEARLSRPGLVVLADQFDPDWRLEVQTGGARARPVPVLRTNRVLRGAWMPAGQHRLEYRYRPMSLAWGAAVSMLAWLGVLAAAWFLRSR